MNSTDMPLDPSVSAPPEDPAPAPSEIPAENDPSPPAPQAPPAPQSAGNSPETAASGPQPPSGAAPTTSYAELAELMRSDPAQALHRTAEMAARHAVEAILPVLAPIGRMQAFAHVSEGLGDEARQFVRDFVEEKGIAPELLGDPLVADLIRSKAQLHELQRSDAGRTSERPIPRTEGAPGHPGGSLDPETRRELGGIEGLYRSLGVEFDAGRILGRLRS